MILQMNQDVRPVSLEGRFFHNKWLISMKSGDGDWSHFLILDLDPIGQVLLLFFL